MMIDIPDATLAQLLGLSPTAAIPADFLSAVSRLNYDSTRLLEMHLGRIVLELASKAPSTPRE